MSWGMPQPLQTHIAIRWSADNPSRPHHAMTAAPNAPQSPPRGIQLPPLYPKRFRRATRRNNAKVRAFHSIPSPRYPRQARKSNRRLMGECTCRPIITRRRRMAPPADGTWMGFFARKLALGPGRSFGLDSEGASQPPFRADLRLSLLAAA